ncbi:hypothetical protein [Francisella orientalis]|uniref:Uncharacterized protein n=1 Tax=Francisella orientalis TaxID=299583 RepID=A0AAP7KJF1_9GAMM|nr:hypothetical protein [Francisella orientalis]AFJ43240.1 hypothetical protein OOM_0751 [Francisella orientalis str. Toba 04]AHB99302.1 hypothetical protein M973_08595 [Francisella orientalis LADL 07-285A]AKN86100.1 hypothetical protein FNO12_1558 [Francisella orientalis FNO12]AKN87638.1 Hypothetical protein FNO24_1560 [Francisella orientalis FNO24]AKN89176.1 Hypothetical protein FNO190_1558 [Francisella orientalis]
MINKIKAESTAGVKLILNQEYIGYEDLALIFGELISLDRLSNIAMKDNQKIRFYFQISEDSLAKYFLENKEVLKDGTIYDNCKDEDFLNDVLKGVSTFNNAIHYVELKEPFLKYDNNSLNGYIGATVICLEN